MTSALLFIESGVLDSKVPSLLKERHHGAVLIRNNHSGNMAIGVCRLYLLRVSRGEQQRPVAPPPQ